jgi:hypothetical protein
MTLLKMRYIMYGALDIKTKRLINQKADQNTTLNQAVQ